MSLDTRVDISGALNATNAWLAPAWDGENVNLVGGDYVPTGGVIRAILIATATGTLKIQTLAGQDLTIPSGLATGVLHSIGAKKIYASGTSATGIVAFA